jgi:hypothetical protein
MSGAALDLFDRREREVYTECRRRSDAFFSEAASVYDHRFWAVRASGSRDGGELRAPQSDAALVAAPAVRAAFDELRRAPSVRLRPTTRLRVESAPTIEGREVVMRDAVLLPAVDAPLRFAAGVNLPALVNLTRHCDDIAALIPAYQATVGRVSVQELLTGVSLLIAHRALINEGSAS